MQQVQTNRALHSSSCRTDVRSSHRWSSSRSPSNARLYPNLHRRQQSAVASSNTDKQQEPQQATQQQSGWVQTALKDPPQWLPFCGSLLAYGAVCGTLLDGIHSSVGLQVYDVAPITVGPLVTSLIVPPLLAIFYLVLGLLTCIADNLTPGEKTSAAQRRAGPKMYSSVVLCFTLLAMNLYTSAKLFEAGIPSLQICIVLNFFAFVDWLVFDNTYQGMWLGVLCGLGAPAAELVLMTAAGVWHYSRPDVAGVFVSWVPWCYALYVPAVSNLARHLWQTCRDQSEQ